MSNTRSPRHRGAGLRAALARLLLVAAAGLAAGPASAVIQGLPTAQPAWVGLVVSEQGAGGAGELIAPGWVLTAGHVALGLKGPSWVRFQDAQVVVTEALVDPLFDPSKPERGHDFGLLRLAQPVDGIGQATLWDGSSGGRLPTGTAVQLVAWGAADIAGTARGVRRIGSTSMADMSALLLMLADSRDGRAGVAPGDSGGAVLGEFEGRQLLLGVLSMADFDGAVSRGAAGPVAAARHFIDARVDGVRWAIIDGLKPLPAPATLALALTALGMAVRPRSR